MPQGRPLAEEILADKRCCWYAFWRLSHSVDARSVFLPLTLRRMRQYVSTMWRDLKSGACLHRAIFCFLRAAHQTWYVLHTSPLTNPRCSRALALPYYAQHMCVCLCEIWRAALVCIGRYSAFCARLRAARQPDFGTSCAPRRSPAPAALAPPPCNIVDNIYVYYFCKIWRAALVCVRRYSAFS